MGVGDGWGDVLGQSEGSIDVKGIQALAFSKVPLQQTVGLYVSEWSATLEGTCRHWPCCRRQTAGSKDQASMRGVSLHEQQQQQQRILPTEVN